VTGRIFCSSSSTNRFQLGAIDVLLELLDPGTDRLECAAELARLGSGLGSLEPSLDITDRCAKVERDAAEILLPRRFAGYRSIPRSRSSRSAMTARSAADQP
jgi:hypothetical protein